MDPDEVVRRIEDVEIQGATAVAEAGIELLQAMDTEGRSEEAMEEAREQLRAARPTEPLLFNALRLSREQGYEEVLAHIREAREQIAAAGADLLADDAAVYTHCHSSTATAVLRRAARDHDIDVHVTETRPLYQGRTTAAELAAAGIPATLHVDSGAGTALDAADRMVIGADAIAPSGAVVNKIGSALFAEAAEQRDIPLTVVADAWKIDPDGQVASEEAIEQRPPEEVWDDAPDAVDVVNPAFELVPPGRVDSIVSELGEHNPNEFMDAVRDAYPRVVT